MGSFDLSSVFSGIPNGVEAIDGLSRSSILWSKVKIVAIFVFLIGGAFVTLQSCINQLRGVDEKELHKSIYDLPMKGNTSNTNNDNINTENRSNQDSNNNRSGDNNEGATEDKRERNKTKDRQREEEVTEENLVSRIEENLTEESEKDERVRSRRRRD